MRKVIGIGETILDIIFKHEQPTAAVPGGSVFNGLVSLGRAGVPVEFISEIGNDKVGGIIKAFMHQNNIGTRYVDMFPDGKSAISLAFLNAQNEAEYTFYKDYPKQRLEVAFPTIQADDIVIFGSYFSINPALRSRVTELMEYAIQQHAIIYYDPNFRAAHAHEAIRLAPSIIENLEFASVVRGSHEDFHHMFGLSDTQKIYDQKIKYYCPNFICTKGGDGIDLYTPSFRKHYDSLPITPISTIGGGDNFNAGILYGLLKHKVTQNELSALSETTWDKIIDCGIAFSSEVCMSYDNYISLQFAEQLKND